MSKNNSSKGHLHARKEEAENSIIGGIDKGKRRKRKGRKKENFVPNEKRS